MKITILENKFNRKINSEINLFDIDYDDLVGMVESPVEYADKADCTYLLPFDHHYTDMVSSAIGECASTYEAIFLDVDSGLSIDRVVEALTNENYQFVLYTSWSHTEEHHRYRIILPLDKPLSKSDFDFMMKIGLYQKLFGFADHSCFMYTGYYTPAKRPLYRFAYNANQDAKPFSVFHPKIKKMMIELKIQYDKQHMKKPQISTSKSLFSVANSHKVTFYLNTPFNGRNGNEISNTSLYIAICVCISANDIKTLRMVVAKAKSEGWTDKEIEQKQSYAQRSKK